MMVVVEVVVVEVVVVVVAVVRLKSENRKHRDKRTHELV
jgi:hypothetical protein